MITNSKNERNYRSSISINGDTRIYFTTCSGNVIILNKFSDEKKTRELINIIDLKECCEGVGYS